MQQRVHQVAGMGMRSVQLSSYYGDTNLSLQEMSVVTSKQVGERQSSRAHLSELESHDLLCNKSLSIPP